MMPIIKITKVNKIESSDPSKIPCLEIELNIDGKIVRENFVDHDYWIEKVDGEERFIKRIRESHLKDGVRIQKEFDNDQIADTKDITEILEFKNREVK